ncbi:MAG TPA: hypothetical protein DCG57_11385 [Candidatus Riflebacteria bacterium]|jgi:drug/metabolite transporter (DMT)-like permease|nr:MAG: hypothetical protein CVV41_12540 [Candidatus Riflebacteria bacterium HGW-Riflebacteria-1]HAE39224.1 hypothetical protein [Candidatus Riflebacteria bacterium]
MTTGDSRKRHKFSVAIAIIVLISINLCWGGSYAVIKYAVEVVPPTTLAFLRFAIGGLFLMLIPIPRRGHLSGRDWKDLFLIGALGLAVSNIFLNMGLTMTTSTKTSIAATLEPVFTIILAVIFLKEVLQRKTVYATVISIVGAMILMLGDKSPAQLMAELQGSGEFLGDLMIALSLFLAAVYSILMKPVAQRIGAVRATSLSFFIGALLLTPIVYLELSKVWPINFTREALLAIMFLGVICNALAFLLWNIILKSTDAGVMAVTLYAQPIGGVITGWVWLGESLSYAGFVGGALIFAGIWLLPKESGN